SRNAATTVSRVTRVDPTRTTPSSSAASGTGSAVTRSGIRSPFALADQVVGGVVPAPLQGCHPLLHGFKTVLGHQDELLLRPGVDHKRRLFGPGEGLGLFCGEFDHGGLLCRILSSCRSSSNAGCFPLSCPSPAILSLPVLSGVA